MIVEQLFLDDQKALVVLVSYQLGVLEMEKVPLIGFQSKYNDLYCCRSMTLQIIQGVSEKAIVRGKNRRVNSVDLSLATDADWNLSRKISEIRRSSF